MSRRPHYCHYHSQFREEASKCKTSENAPKCEFQRFTVETSSYSDLRNKIRHDQRNSLKGDLRDHLKKARMPERGDRKRSRLSRQRTHLEKEEDLFERRGNTRSKAELVHISEIQIEEDPADEQNEEDRSLSTGRRRRSRERSQKETEYYHTVNVTKTISNDRYKKDKSENPNPRTQEDQTLDKKQSHRSNDHKSSKSDHNYPGNNRRSKTEPNSRKGPRYKPEDSRNSGYISEEDPTSPKRSKRGDKGDMDANTEDNSKTPRRRRHRNKLEKSSDSSSNDEKKGKQKQRDRRKSLQDDEKYQELLQYLRYLDQLPKSESSSELSSESSSESSSDDEKMEDKGNAKRLPTNDDGLDRSGMPKNKKKPDKCPVPECEASNRAGRNNKGKFEDTDNAHRYLLNCPKIHAMSVTDRWEYFKKAGSKCKRCFSTQHKFQNCPMQLRNPKFCNVQIGNKNKCGGAHHWLLHVDGHI